MWTVIAVSLLTLAVIGGIFLGSIIVLWKHPPLINVTIAVPDRFVLVQQKLPASIETDPSLEAPIPAEVLDYINLESDTWAQDARKRRARALYNDSQDWKYAFRMLQKEDGQ
jgi:hypothetical protein